MTTKYEYLKDYYKYTNWRYVGRSNITLNHEGKKLTPFGHHNKKGIWVILDTYRSSCFIYGIDIKDFLDICEEGNYHSFIDHYWEPSKLHCCTSCNGAGKLDWISKITGPQPFNKIRHKYVRDKTKILKFQHNEFLKDQCIFAPTKVFEGERICKECKGTGIYIKNINDLASYDIKEEQ